MSKAVFTEHCNEDQQVRGCDGTICHSNLIRLFMWGYFIVNPQLLSEEKEILQIWLQEAVCVYQYFTTFWLREMIHKAYGYVSDQKFAHATVSVYTIKSSICIVSSGKECIYN